MKKYITVVIGLLIALPLLSQSWVSSNILKGTADLTEISSSSTSDGGVISMGYFTGSVSCESFSIDAISGRDYFLAKFDDSGHIEWLKSLGSSANTYAVGGVDEFSPGFIYVTGSFRNYIKYSPTDSILSTGAFDIFLAKYDLTGNVVWFKNIGSGAKGQLALNLGVDQFGDLLVSGFFLDSIAMDGSAVLTTENPFGDSFYAKLRSLDGDLIWIKHLRGIDYSGPTMLATLATNNSNIYVSTFKDSIRLENDTIVSLSNSNDILVFKTDVDGNVLWNRKVSGVDSEYAYSIDVDADENIYFAGHYYSPSIIFQSNATETFTIDQNNGDLDIFIAKYTKDGALLWAKSNGGTAADRIYNLDFINDEVHVSGFFSDELVWGGITLNSAGASDQDMFYGSLDADGNYRSANSFAGRNNSSEEARALFFDGDQLTTVMRSNSDLLVLGDSIYTNPSQTYVMVIGVIGCLDLTVDATSTDVTSCKGDATGSINVSAADGFGGPFSYSIDNGATYQEGAPSFTDLAAGDYSVVVIDMENCAESFGTVTITEPDTLAITVVSSTDIVGSTAGEIVVEGTGGGSGSYFYTIDPVNEAVQTAAGTFAIPNEGTYTVAVNDANDCGPVSTDDIVIIQTVSINSTSVRDGKIYPNPSNGMITVEFSTENQEMAVEVYSMTGQRVMSKQVFSNGGEVSETFDMSSLAKGTYLIRVDGETLSSGVILK